MSTTLGSYSASLRSGSASAWIALVPIHARAVCARTPASRISARSVPWQPASIAALDGSPTTARSPRSHSGSSRSTRPSPLRAASTSSQS